MGSQTDQNKVGILLPDIGGNYSTANPSGAGGGGGAIVASDNFESGNLSAPTGMSWTSGAQSSVQAHTPRSSGSGSSSLRMRYAVATSLSEQRFQLNNSYDEAYFRFWLHVPANFEHITDAPSNIKLMSIWMDDYDGAGDGATVVWEYWDDGVGGSEVTFHWSEGNFTGAGVHIQPQPFINVATDLNRWAELTFRVKKSTTRSSTDGIIQFWRRWENEGSKTLLHSVTNALIPAPISTAIATGWKAGYLLGWSNPQFDVQTDFYIDDFQVSTGGL